MLNKKIISILLMLSIALTLQSAYKTNQYMKVVDVKGRVKISSQKAIVKPARNGDLLFTKDNISTENNSSLNIDESYDKTGNTKLTLDNGDFLIAASSNAKADSITVLTSNASIKVSGAAAISYTNGNTKAQFLYGEGEVNGTKVAQFTEVNIDNSNKLSTKDIELNEEFENNIIEVTSMPYVETIIPEASNMADVKNYYEKYNNKTISETNTEAASIDYVGNTNENRTTLIITNETK